MLYNLTLIFKLSHRPDLMLTLLFSFDPLFSLLSPLLAYFSDSCICWY